MFFVELIYDSQHVFNVLQLYLREFIRGQQKAVDRHRYGGPVGPCEQIQENYEHFFSQFSFFVELIYHSACLKYFYSSTFDNLAEVSKKLLTDAGMEGQLDHANRFRKIMNIPLSYLKDLSALISRFSDVYDRVGCITKTCPCNIQRTFSVEKIEISMENF